MKDIQKIAALSGRSKATVSKVLNHRPGVSVETREEILRIAAQFAEETVQPMGEVSVIVPDNPKFFWSQIPSVVASYMPQWKDSVCAYTSLYRSAGLENYVERAIRGGSKVIIVAAEPGERLQQMLEQAAKTCLVIQLCEYTPIPGTVYVGSDLYDDGRALAEALREQLRGKRCVILRPDPTGSNYRRVDGFVRTLAETSFVYIEENTCVDGMYSAVLARRLSKVGAFDYLFCASGTTALACEGLAKLRMAHTPQCIGFESSAKVEAYFRQGSIAALAVQDIEGQTRAALEMAKRYLETGARPEQAQTLIASSIRLGSLGETRR